MKTMKQRMLVMLAAVSPMMIPVLVMASEDGSVTHKENLADTNAVPLAQSAGWIQEDGRWRYLQGDGTFARNACLKIDGQWYFFDADGWMQKGWVTWEGAQYFADSSGAMKTGWLHFEGNWYFFDSSGALKTGWVKDRGTYYFMDANGAMKTGWLKQDGHWYYLDHSGAMKTGWLKQSGNWYYLDSSGVMLTDTWITPDPGGDRYYLNQEGIWTDTESVGDDSILLQYGPMIGQLTNIPYNLIDQGFIIEKGDRFGMISSSGTWMVQPDYRQVKVYTNYATAAFSEEPGVTANLFVDRKGVHHAPIGGLGGWSSKRPVLTQDGTVKILEIYENKLYPVSFAPNPSYNVTNTMLVVHPISSTMQVDTSIDYLWSPTTNQVFGPYTKQTVPYRLSQDWDYDSLQPFVLIYDSLEYGGYHGLFGLRESNGTYTLHSPDTTKTAGGFTRVEFPGIENAIGWHSDGSFSVYDLNMNVVYTSSMIPGIQLQNGSGVVNGKTMVQYKDNWYLVPLK